MFKTILKKTSSIIGEVVKLRQFLHTADGKKFLSSGTEIAGESNRMPGAYYYDVGGSTLLYMEGKI